MLLKVAEYLRITWSDNEFVTKKDEEYGEDLIYDNGGSIDPVI